MPQPRWTAGNKFVLTWEFPQSLPHLALRPLRQQHLSPLVDERRRHHQQHPAVAALFALAAAAAAVIVAAAGPAGIAVN